MKIKDYAYATDDLLTDLNMVNANVTNVEHGKIIATFKVSLSWNSDFQRLYTIYPSLPPLRNSRKPAQIWDVKMEDAKQFAFFLMNYKSIENKLPGEVDMTLPLDVGEPLLAHMKLLLNKGQTSLNHISALRVHGMMFISTYENKIDYSRAKQAESFLDSELFEYDKNKMEIYIDRIPANPSIPDEEYETVIWNTITTLLYPMKEPWQTITIKIRDRQLKQLFEVAMLEGLLFKRTDDEFIFLANSSYISSVVPRFYINSIDGIETKLDQLNQQLTVERALLEEMRFKVQWIKVLKDEGAEKARQMVSVDGSSEQNIFRADKHLAGLLNRYGAPGGPKTKKILSAYMEQYERTAEGIEMSIIELEKQRDRLYFPQNLVADLYSRGKDLTSTEPAKKKKRRMMNMFKLSLQS